MDTTSHLSRTTNATAQVYSNDKPPSMMSNIKPVNKVSHDYHDHANYPNDDYTAGPASSIEQSFPAKLHYMLDDMERDGLSHIISWSPHGRCFVVHNTKLFVEKVLGSWFRQTKIASFQRQLNIYGFQRLTKTGVDKGGYYHELFLRGKPGLAMKIQRNKLKGTKTRRASSPESEPNFSEMSELPQNGSAYTRNLVDHTCPNQSGRVLCTSAPVPHTLHGMAPSLVSPVDFKGTYSEYQPTARHTYGRGFTPTSISSSLSLMPASSLSLIPQAPMFAYPWQTSNNSDTLWASLAGTAPLSSPADNEDYMAFCMLR